MAFNRGNSPYRCPPDCPDRSPICHTSETSCNTYAAARARAEAEKTAERQRKALANASEVLIESRMRQKRQMKISK